jgi:hypothetical protein
LSQAAHTTVAPFPPAARTQQRGEGRQNYDDIGECQRTTALQVDGAACQ